MGCIQSAEEPVHHAGTQAMHVKRPEGFEYRRFKIFPAEVKVGFDGTRLPGIGGCEVRQESATIIPLKGRRDEMVKLGEIAGHGKENCRSLAGKTPSIPTKPRGLLDKKPQFRLYLK